MCPLHKNGHSAAMRLYAKHVIVEERSLRIVITLLNFLFPVFTNFTNTASANCHCGKA